MATLISSTPLVDSNSTLPSLSLFSQQPNIELSSPTMVIMLPTYPINSNHVNELMKQITLSSKNN